VRLTTKIVGNELDISWPLAGGRLQQTDNLANTWADVPNSTTTNRVIVPIDPNGPDVFYRLIWP
jgi:hypothetical protein